MAVIRGIQDNIHTVIRAPKYVLYQYFVKIRIKIDSKNTKITTYSQKITKTHLYVDFIAIFPVKPTHCGTHSILRQNRIRKKTPQNRHFCESNRYAGCKSNLGCFSLPFWGIIWALVTTGGII